MAQGHIRLLKAAWDKTIPTTLPDWQKALKLPDSYRLVEVRESACGMYPNWLFVVENDLIPETTGRVKPDIVPIYRKDAGGHVTLDHIETRVWDGSAWCSLDEVA
ncbi:MAG TPA: hypothetical protein VGT44_23185 [Ktedonobacteraceae bacterium]|nr:hypothetical protein [Ktedonobacteraceae bacterium]